MRQPAWENENDVEPLKGQKEPLAHACQLMHEEWRISKLLSRNSVRSTLPK